MRVLFILLLAVVRLSGQEAQRIENEYKLAVPEKIATELWSFLQGQDFISELNKERLSAEVSVEVFYDTYFDNENSALYEAQIGLRRRKRFVDGVLMKELIQLKLPLDDSGVSRTEVKYEIKNSRDQDDILGRHSLFQYIKKRDREDLMHQLARVGVDALEMRPSLRLKQNRSRLYLSDSLGSIATLTLDKVTDRSFPFLAFTELEMELNEIRYTDADQKMKSELEEMNTRMKEVVQTKYPSLHQDQTPKYNKMRNHQKGSWASKIYAQWMWIVLGIIALAGMYRFATKL